MGKNSVIFPVNRRAMDRSIQLLRQGIKDSKMGKKQALKALQRLGAFVKRVDETSEFSI